MWNSLKFGLFLPLATPAVRALCALNFEIWSYRNVRMVHGIISCFRPKSEFDPVFYHSKSSFFSPLPLTQDHWLFDEIHHDQQVESEHITFYILEKWPFIFWRSDLLYFGEVTFYISHYFHIYFTFLSICQFSYAQYHFDLTNLMLIYVVVFMWMHMC